MGGPPGEVCTDQCSDLRSALGRNGLLLHCPPKGSILVHRVAHFAVQEREHVVWMKITLVDLEAGHMVDTDLLLSELGA